MQKTLFFTIQIIEILLVWATPLAKAQTILLNNQDVSPRAIFTAVPFLRIPPDARAAGMGDVGTASTPDAFAAHWNPAKYAFIEKEVGFTLSHIPWQQDFTNETSLSYLTAYYRFKPEQAIAFSLNYFNRGSLEITNNTGQTITTFKPHEYCLTLIYARKIAESLSVGVSGKFIYSQLAPDILNNQQMERFVGSTGAVDISAFYDKKIQFVSQEWNIRFGLIIKDIGPKISYINRKEQEFLPTSLRIGTAATVAFGFFHKFTFALDLSKLLVPSPPVRDSQGNIVKGNDAGKVGVMRGIFSSFGDAPGGMREEFQEVVLGAGIEYMYDDIFIARIGYANENPQKGDRTYLTIGIGTKFKFFSMDIAYMFRQLQRNQQTGEVMRFSFGFHFGNPTKPFTISPNNANNPLRKLSSQTLVD